MIFMYLDNDPLKCAKLLTDKHLVIAYKTALDILNNNNLTCDNHKAANEWIKQTSSNFKWFLGYLQALRGLITSKFPKETIEPLSKNYGVISGGRHHFTAPPLLFIPKYDNLNISPLIRNTMYYKYELSEEVPSLYYEKSDIRLFNISNIFRGGLSEKIAKFENDLPGLNKYVGRPSKWGNNFIYAAGGFNLEKSLARYKEFIFKKSADELSELIGKNIGCWCLPERCHGMLIVEAIEEKCFKDT